MACNLASASGFIDRTISVPIKPGEIVFTLMP